MPIENIPPLPIGMPIVDPKTGAATREFAQWWQQLFGNANALDNEKLANSMTTGRLLGRSTAGEGEVEELTLSEALDFIGSAAQGDVLYRGASGWERLGAGTSGLFLQTNGTGANPAWAIPSGAAVSSDTETGGNFNITVPSGARRISLALYIPGASDGGGSGCHAGIRFNSDTGSNYNYHRASIYNAASETVQLDVGTSQTSILTQRGSGDIENAIQIIFVDILHADAAGKALVSVRSIGMTDQQPRIEFNAWWTGDSNDITAINIYSAFGAAIPSGVEWQLVVG